MIMRHLVARQLFLLFFAFAVTLGSTSCSVVVGNVKPVDEKSTHYGVSDLSQTNSDWKKLDLKGEAAKDQDLSPTEISDIAFQSKETASIISLDSACRHAQGSTDRDLKTLTNLLLLGITDVTLREERGLEVQKAPALETTIQGNLNGEVMKIRTVVLRRQTCVYDFVYMARPQFFDRQAEDFSHFVASLRLKE